MVVDLLESDEGGQGRECCCDCFGSFTFDVVSVDAVKRGGETVVLGQ